MSVSTPLDLISKSLSDIGALAAGEPVEPNVANDAFDTLNDMIDQWSNQKMLLPYVQEVIHELTGGTYVYTIGPLGNVGSVVSGSISGTTLTVSSLTSGAISVGQTVSGTGVSVGTVISSLNTGRGGNGTSAVGTYNVNQSQTVTGASLTTYAVRPVRINSAFVRITTAITGTLDYPVAPITSEEYELIGIKTLSGPWPRAVYYQPSLPMGVLNYWPNPSSGEMHLFCDMVLTRFQSLSDTMTLQPGAVMALRWNLAELLIPSYGRNDQMLISMVQSFASQGKMYLKRSNMQPQQASRFDPVLISNKRKDAGWILSGGFN
jgi:hypothetical protein